MSLEREMELSKLQGERHEMNMKLKLARDMLASALCARCGEALGHDEELDYDGEEAFHARCEEEK